jgi:hypothetical protein
VVDIDRLHKRLFGYVPAKQGTAYERIGAIVLAMFGWESVVHDTDERPAGRQATHRLDITARDPKGEVKRLLVECKEWNDTVGQGTVNTLVGVRNQIGADAAVILSTEGFTSGALNVAIDEDIALVRLAAYDPAKYGTNFATRIVVTTRMYTPAHSGFNYELGDTTGLSGFVEIPAKTGAAHFVHADGSPAEQVMDVLRANASPMQEGEFRQRAELKPGRYLRSVDGSMVEMAAITWTETNRLHEFEVVHEAEGNPVLFMEQINDEGEGESGRLLVSEDLFAWDIDGDGNVVARGTLGSRAGT